jgi:hypothetical protein
MSGVSLCSTATTPHGDSQHTTPYAKLAGASFTGVVLLPDGSVSAPSLGLVSAATLGLFKAAAGRLGLVGTTSVDFYDAAVAFLRAAPGSLGFASGGTFDLFLTRDAANALGLRNGATPQRLGLYATYTDPSNYERIALYSDGVDFYLATEALGTGNPDRSLRIGTKGAGLVFFHTVGVPRWAIDTSGHWLASTDGAYDIGSAGVSRPRDLHLAGAIVAAGDITTGGRLHGDGSALTGITGGSGGISNTGSTTIESDSDNSGAEDIALKTSQVVRWLVKGGTGHVFANLDAAYDIGASGANRPRDVYVGRNLSVNGAGPHVLGGTTDLALRAFTKAGLPAAGTAGHLARVTDDVRGLWNDFGTAWGPARGSTVDARWFGLAEGASAATNTAAIAAAFAAGPGGFGLVYTAAGTYAINATVLTGPLAETANQAWGLVGDGPTQTKFTYAGAGVALTLEGPVGNTRMARLQGFSVVGTSAGAAGVQVGATHIVASGWIDDVYVTGFTAANAKGFSFVSSVAIRVADCYAFANNFGFVLSGAGPNNLLTFLNCLSRQNLVNGSTGGVGLYADSGQFLTFVGCLFESNDREGVILKDQAAAGLMNLTWIGSDIVTNQQSPGGGTVYELVIDSPNTGVVVGPGSISFLDCLIGPNATGSRRGFNVIKGHHVKFEQTITNVGTGASQFGAGSSYCTYERPNRDDAHTFSVCKIDDLGYKNNTFVGEQDDDTVHRNRILNGGCEVDADWVNSGSPGTNARSNTQAFRGQASRHVVSGAAGDGAKSALYSTTTSVAYRLRLWVYPAATANVRVSIRKGDDSGLLFDGAATPQSVTANKWNLISIDVTESAGGAGAYVLILTGTVLDFYFDEVEVRVY